MQYRRLGRTGLQVSRLCLGTMNFGSYTSEPDSFALMDRALELGLNFFDTANVYGGRAGKGATEEIVGRWFAQGGGRRDKTVLATKVYGRVSDWPNDGRCSALHIRRACEDSLRRLQTDHIDLYQMHHIDRDAPWDEVWQAMEVLVQQGKVLYVGSSNFAGWHIADAQGRAARRGFLGLVSEQSLYNLSDRMVELEVLPACQALGLAVLPWSPLGGGTLSGALRRTDEGRHTTDLVAKRIERHRPKIEAYEAFCDELGKSPADVAVAWLLAQPAVTSTIIGPRTTLQLDQAVEGMSLELVADALERLDRIWPGPGGPAPEAYAW